MSRSHAPNPVCRLPQAVAVQAHIGHLLRELRLARRLYKLAKAADHHRHTRVSPTGVSRG